MALSWLRQDTATAPAVVPMLAAVAAAADGDVALLSDLLATATEAAGRAAPVLRDVFTSPVPPLFPHAPAKPFLTLDHFVSKQAVERDLTAAFKRVWTQLSTRVRANADVAADACVVRGRPPPPAPRRSSPALFH